MSSRTLQSLKEKTRNVVREASNKGSSFETWSSDCLKNLLIEHNVQVRGSRQASRGTLVRICDQLFGGDFGGDEREFVKVYTMEDMVQMDQAARTIQWVYIEYRQRQAQPRKSFQNIVVDVVKEEGSERFTFSERDEGQSFDVANYAHASVENGGAHYAQEQYDYGEEIGEYGVMQPIMETNEEYDEEQNEEERRSLRIETSFGEERDASPEEIPHDELMDGVHDEECQQEVLNEHDREENASTITSTEQIPKVSSHVKKPSIDEPFPPDHIDVVVSTPRRRNSSQRQMRSQRKLEQELETQWVKPSWKLAKEFEAENRPHRTGKDKKPYDWKTVTLGRHCTVGGCGEQLDLWDEGQMSEFAQFGSGITNYFKFLKWCCWVMFILSVIHIPPLVLNAFGNSVVYDGSILARTMLGNLGSSKVGYVRIPGCDSSRYQFEQCTLSKNELALLYAFLDALGTIIVIIGYHWLRKFEQNEVDHLNRSTVTASDYTLRVSGIPPKIKEREIAAHFAGLTSSPIAEVNLAFRNEDEIRMYVNRGQIMKQRNQCVQRIRYERSVGEFVKGGKSASKRRIKKLLRERKKLTSLVDTKDAQRTMNVDPDPDAIQAFVTFDTEDGFVKAISAYQMNWIRSCFYPKRLRLGGEKIWVDQAPEPSTIIWENIQVKERSRFSRKCLTTCIASLAILLSVYFTFVARDFKIETLKSMSGECPDFFDDLSRDEQYDMIGQDISLSHCFCAVLDAQDQLNEPLCRDFVKNQVRATAMSYGAGFMVCFMNMFFTILMDRAGSFEKHQSLDDMESSNMTRLFILRFLNTGCLVLLYSLRFIQVIVGVKFEDPQNFNIDWYETGGVAMAIVMIINIFSPHIGSLISYYQYKKRIRNLERNLTEDMETKDEYKIWHTQEELNMVYLGPPFKLNYRYTQLLVNFYICWMYAISMPILPFIGCISFFVSYWVDKLLFCNFYQIPPNYSDAIGSRSTTLIGTSILFHIFMSCWILGNNQIFSGVSIIKNREISITNTLKISDIMLKRHIVVLELVAILFIMYVLVKKFMNAFEATLSKIFRFLLCGKGNKVKKLKAVMNTVQVTYSGARTRGVIKGLASYNIMQNPKYQEAFAITAEFAKNHNRLSSIRGYNTKENTLDSESESFDSDETPESV